tara:strand:+ start:356 stop:688 length:333 start_codon:yes stop_codon:yes gene_type:complete
MNAMKFQTTKTTDFEKLVRKMTRVVKQNTNYNDDDIIILIDNIIEVLIINDYEVNRKILYALVYLYTTTEIERMNNSNIIIMFLKNIFINKIWKRNQEVAQQQIVIRSPT